MRVAGRPSWSLRVGDDERMETASFGGAAVPFQLAVVVLPVDDDDIRPLGADRYLVPERLFLDQGVWRAWLELVATDLSTP
jgi:hypothetical protein